MKIVVYGKTDCGQCTLTKEMLRRNGVSHEYVNLDVDDPTGEIGQKIMSEGHRSLPVVKIVNDNVNGIQAWTGFRPDLLRKLSA